LRTLSNSASPAAVWLDASVAGCEYQADVSASFAGSAGLV
jgi:hypothetical protein